MKLWRFGSFSIILLLVAGLSFSGCALWNRVWPGKGGEQAAEKSKAPATSNANQAAAVPGSNAAKTDKSDPKEKDTPGEKPLTEGQKEWEEKIARSPFLVSGEYFRQRERSEERRVGKECRL